MTYADEVLVDDPTHWYRLGESSGTVVVDASGNGRDGVYVNTPTLGVTGAIENSTDKAVTFARASSEYITFPSDGLPSGSAPYSIECWIKPNTIDSQQAMVGWGNYGTANQANFLRLDTATSNGVLNSWVSNDLKAPATLSTSLWQHVVATFDGTVQRLFLNAVEIGSRTPTTLPSIATTAPTIARTGTADYADGGLDEVAIYDTALSAERIMAHYLSSKNAVAGSGLDLDAKLTILKMILNKSYTPYTYPLTVKLLTTIADSATKGVECRGNEYEEQPVVWNAPAATTYVDNQAPVEFAPLDSDLSFDIYGYEIWDSSADERRIFYETFAAAFTVPADTPTTFNPNDLAMIVDDTNDKLSDVAETAVLNWLAGHVTTNPFSIPLEVRLMTANGGESTAGTECIADLYERQPVYWDDPELSGSTATSYAFAKNELAVTFPALSSTATVNVTGYEIWDTAAIPQRIAYQNYGSAVSVPANTEAVFAIDALEFRVI